MRLIRTIFIFTFLVLGLSVPVSADKASDDALKAFEKAYRAEKLGQEEALEREQPKKKAIKTKKPKKFKKAKKAKKVKKAKAKPKKRSREQKKILNIVKQETQTKYKEIISLYKKKEYDQAHKRIVTFKRYLYGQDVDDRYRDKMFRKVNQISIRIDGILDKQRKADAKRRAKESKHTTRASQKRVRVQEKTVQSSKVKRSKSDKHRQKQLLQEERDRAAFLKREAENKRKTLRREREDADRRLQKEISRTYGEAIRLFKSKSYDEALVLFDDIDELSPGYKATDNYLQKLKSLTKSKPKKASSYKRSRKQLIADSLNTFKK